MTIEQKTVALLNSAEIRFAEMLAKSDYAGASAVFGPDAVVLPPAVAPARGRENIKVLFERNTQLKGIFLAPNDRRPLGSEVIGETGRLRLTVAEDQQLAQEKVAKYYLVWRWVDSSWMMEALMWNRAARPRGQAQRR